MFEWELHWPSTAEERYGDVMLPKAEEVIAASGLQVVERFGGCMVDVDDDDPTAADNAFIVVAPDDDTPLKLARDLTEALGRTVRVTQLEAVGADG